MSDYSEARSAVEDTACRLSELSRKEDCDVIHNLMMIVQDRHKKLQLHVAERGKILEEVKKNAKQVHVQSKASITGNDCKTSMWYLPFLCFSLMNLGV